MMVNMKSHKMQTLSNSYITNKWMWQLLWVNWGQVIQLLLGDSSDNLFEFILTVNHRWCCGLRNNPFGRLFQLH